MQKMAKLLIVDDEADVCNSAQAYFGKRGFNVTTTGSGTEAIALIPVVKPDVVILDITLKDLSGKDVLQKLRKHDQKTQVIVMTGNFYPEHKIKEITDLGVCAYLNKASFGLAELEDIINKIIGNTATAGPEVKTAVNPPIPKRSQQEIVHDLTNIHASVRNDCDIFCRNLKDGFYKTGTKKDLQELVEMAVEIMHNSIEKLKKAREIVDQIKEG